MGATFQEATATKDGSQITVKGTVETTRGGYTLMLAADDPGIGGEFDKTLRLRLTATEPEAGPDVMGTVSFEGTFGGNEDDESVAINLSGVTTADDKDSVSVPIT